MKNSGTKDTMHPTINGLLISSQSTIRQALQAMESGLKDERPSGIILAVDDEKHLLGVVTDGDIRQALLKGVDLDSPIDQIMTKDPILVQNDQIEVGSYSEVINSIRKSGRMKDPSVAKIIVVDGEKRVVSIISLFDMLKRNYAKSQTICIVGMGYVGLTLAIAMAEAGLTVYGVEANERVRTMLMAGKLHFHEVGLDRAFDANLGKRLRIGGELGQNSENIYIITVGTPVSQDKIPYLGDLQKAGEAVAKVLKVGDMVILRSTVPIGTTRNVIMPVLERSTGLVCGRDFDLVFAPERTAAGKALVELAVLPQIIGSYNKSGTERAIALFRELTQTVVAVDSLEEAEAVKLFNNSFRDHIFSFANEAAIFCKKWDLDVNRVISTANKGYVRDPIPLPSPGVGGTCLYKDPYILAHSARQVGIDPVIIGRSREINEYMPEYIIEKIQSFFTRHKKDISAAKVLVVGFAFKGDPETSDMRDSTTLPIVELLRKKTGNIFGYDPVVNPEEITKTGVTSVLLQDGFDKADCVIVMNNHRSYPSWNIYELLGLMNGPALFLDTWRMFSQQEICKVKGVTYGTLSVDYVNECTNEESVIHIVNSTNKKI